MSVLATDIDPTPWGAWVGLIGGGLVLILAVIGLTADRYSPATARARARVLATLPDDPLGLDREGIQAWWSRRQATDYGDFA